MNDGKPIEGECQCIGMMKDEGVIWLVLDVNSDDLESGKIVAVSRSPSAAEQVEQKGAAHAPALIASPKDTARC